MNFPAWGEKFKNRMAFSPGFITGCYLVLMLSVFLLYTGFEGYSSITHSKYTAFLLISLAYVFLFLLSFIPKANREGFISHIKANITPVHYLIALFWLCCLISTVASDFFPDTLLGGHRFEGFLTISIYVFVFFAVSLWGKYSKVWLWAFALGITVFCFICFLQFMGYNPLKLYPEGLNYYDAWDKYRYEFLGTIGNSNLCAGVLSVAACIFAVSLVRLKSKSRFLLLIPLIMVLVVTVLSKVAAAYLGVFGGIVFSCPVAMTSNKRLRLILLIVLLIIVLLCFGLLFAFDMGNGTLHEIHALLHGEWNDDFGTSRLFIWRNVCALIPEHPLLGGGPDTLVQRMTVDFQRYDSDKGRTLYASIDAAHNEYLNIGVNEGLLALVFYLSALILAFVIWYVRSPRNSAAAICGAGVMGYCIQAFFGIRMMIIAPYFWIPLALLCSYNRNPENSKKRNRPVG